MENYYTPDSYDYTVCLQPRGDLVWNVYVYVVGRCAAILVSLATVNIRIYTSDLQTAGMIRNIQHWVMTPSTYCHKRSLLLTSFSELHRVVT